MVSRAAVTPFLQLATMAEGVDDREQKQDESPKQEYDGNWSILPQITNETDEIVAHLPKFTPTSALRPEPSWCRPPLRVGTNCLVLPPNWRAIVPGRTRPRSKVWVC